MDWILDLKDMPPEAAFNCWCHITYEGPCGGDDPRFAEGILKIIDAHPQCPFHGRDGVATINAALAGLRRMLKAETNEPNQRFAWEVFVRRAKDGDVDPTIKTSTLGDGSTIEIKAWRIAGGL